MFLSEPDVKVGFGVTVLPGRLDEFVEWCQVAEDCGFNTVGVGDSQSLYRECFLACALALEKTRSIKIGARVINPMTRHPAVSASAAATLAEMAPGRVMLGVGSGDSAVHNAGVEPAKLAELEAYTRALRDLLVSGVAQYHGETARLAWRQPDVLKQELGANASAVPVYIAASGPRTLTMAGAVADGVIIQTGLQPEVVEESLACIRRGAESAGRDYDAIDKSWFPWVRLANSREEAVEQILHSLASGAKHLARFTTEGKHIPEHLKPAIEQVYREYKFEQHQIPGNDNGKLVAKLGLAEYLADRFAIVGTPKDCVATIERAAEAGVSHLWMSVHFADRLKFMRDWSEHVISKFA